MYQKNHICTYQYYDKNFYEYILEPFDKSDVEEFESLSGEIYRWDICNVFNPNSVELVIDDDAITQLISEPKMTPCIDIIKEKMPLFTPEYVLFSYDYLFLTHQCICTEFSKEAIDLLVSKLNKEIVCDQT